MAIDINVSLLNQTINETNLSVYVNHLRCVEFLSSTEAIVFRDILLVFMGAILFFELYHRAVNYFNKKYDMDLPNIDPSLNKIFFIIMGFIVMSLYDVNRWYFIYGGAIGYWIVFNDELSGGVDKILFTLKIGKKYRQSLEKTKK